MDLLVLVPDWTITLITVGTDGSQVDGGDSVRLVRTVRLVRLVRILRLAKFKKITSNIQDLCNTEYASIIASIVKMLLALLLINHIVACLWWGASSTETNSWVHVYNFDNVSVYYQYLSSFHWSITQFTPASMHIQPQNTRERLYAVTVVIFGLVCFSYLIGSITGLLSQLRSLQDDSHFWKVRRFLRQHSVDKVLATKIEKYLNHRWTKMTEKLSKQDVPLLKHLSHELDGELQASLAVPHLSVHPMLKKLEQNSPHTVHRLALDALNYRLYAENTVVFYKGELASHMLFQVGGSCRYLQFTSSGKATTEIVDSQEDWMSEQVLWMNEWHHQGRLSALTDSELLMISPLKFSEVVSMSPQAMLMVSGYARNFVQWLMQDANEGRVSDIFQGETVSPAICKLIPYEKQARQSLRPRWSQARLSLRPR